MKNIPVTVSGAFNKQEGSGKDNCSEPSFLVDLLTNCDGLLFSTRHFFS